MSSPPKSLERARSAPPLVHMGPQWLGPVLGWCGLALAWRHAVERFGPVAEAAALACALVALSTFLVVLGASLVRATRHPQALAEDLAHPFRHAFVAMLPVSILLLAALGTALYGPGAALGSIWLAGVVLQAGVSAWVISRWLSGRLQWAALTPVVYIPIVGNLLAPLAGAPLGWPMLSWAFFGVGIFFWPVVTAMLLVRQIHQPLPERIQAAWFVAIAPPSVAGSAAMALGAADELPAALLGVAAVMAAASATRVPTIARQGFSMTAWTVSFPMAAVSAALLQAAAAFAPALAMPAAIALAISTVVVLGLSLATFKGLQAGTLLAPEPVAMLSVDKATGQ